MKNTIKLIGIIALAAAIGFSMAACGDGAGGGDSGPAPETYTSTSPDGSTTYTLTISKAAKAANGDAYTLTVSGNENGRSTGTITVSGGTYTLTPGNNSGALTVTIGGGGMTNISGTVTYDGGGSMTNPGALSPVTSGGGSVEATSGELRISGIAAKYNGKYAAANSTLPFGTIVDENTLNLMAVGNISGTNASNGIIIYGLIKDGSVTLKVWKMTGTESNPKAGNYTGNDKNVSFYVNVFDVEQEISSINGWPVADGQIEVSFTNGKGSVTSITITDVDN